MSASGDFVTGSVPEPSTWALMIVGFYGLGTLARRRISKASVGRPRKNLTHAPLVVNRPGGAICSAASPNGARKKSLVVFWLKRGVLQRGHLKAIVSTSAWRRYGELFLELTFIQGIAFMLATVRELRMRHRIGKVFFYCFRGGTN